MLKVNLLTPTLILSFLFYGGNGISQNTAVNLLKESIVYHDPLIKWQNATIDFNLRESRPGAPDRITKISLNNRRDRFHLEQTREGHTIKFIIRKKKTNIKFDGKTPKDTSIINKYRLNAERANTIRNYYTYLYSLPMRLENDGGLIQENIIETTFNGESALAIKVSYPPEVGNDIWYFYFDPETKKLIGYQFYHDEDKKDGEYIVLEDQINIDSFKIPRERSWYTNATGEYLGKDIILDFQP